MFLEKEKAISISPDYYVNNSRGDDAENSLSSSY